MGTDTKASDLCTPVPKGKKLGIKRVKKKADLNISTVKLKSVSSSPKNFSFLNASVHKQTLRANNRALARSLSKARLDIRNVRSEVQEVKSHNQELSLELLRLKRLVGIKDEEIEIEVRQRMQEEMLRMDSLLDGLTQSMIQSSTIINDLKIRTSLYSSRRSTGSVRSSTGNKPSSDVTKPVFNPRSLLKEKSEDIMSRYLSNADEYIVPSCNRIYDKTTSSGMDMSIIAEQSVLIDDSNDSTNLHTLDSVSEVMTDVSASRPSRLPQRVLKESLSSSDLAPMDSEPIESNIITVLNKDESKSKGKSVTEKKSERNCEKGKDKKSENHDDRVKNISKDKKAVSVESGNNTKGKDSKEKEKLEELDNFIDADISAFGFSSLVSGSPIHTDKKDSVKVKTKSTDSSDVKNKEKSEAKQRRETFVMSKSISLSKIESSSQDKKVITTKSKSRKKVEQEVTSKKNSHPTNPPASVDLSALKKSKETPVSTGSGLSAAKELKETHCTTEPPTVSDEKYASISDPFKPTKVLLRSPVYTKIQSASPEEKVDSFAFLAKIRKSVESKAVVSEPLPEINFSDEPTTYFDSEMEFTSVIDSAKFVQSLRSEKSNTSSNKDMNNSNKDDDEKKHAENVSKSNKEDKSGGDTVVDGLDSQNGDNAAVEVRTKKPGVFTFSVGRKEADGTRKPVPETTRSKARSKKKRNVTPEKEERKTGEDRDMFNFGDRTPTVPLEKLAKSKNVFDLSMNDTVAPTFEDFKKRKDMKEIAIPEPKPDEHIYYLPLKGSPDEKPAKSSRSRSRSKSKKRDDDDDDDEDWVPDRKSTGRSKSRGRKSEKGEPVERRGRSRSRKRIVDDDDNDNDDVVVKEKPSARSKSRGRKEEKEESAERTGRSRSRRRATTVNYDEGSDGVDATVLQNSQDTKVDKESSHAESTEESIKSNEDSIESDEIVISSRKSSGRSRSRHRKPIVSDSEESADTNLDDKSQDKSLHVRRSTRSKSQVRKIVLDDSDEENREANGNSKDVEVKSRSRSLSRRKALTNSTENDETVSKQSNQCNEMSNKDKLMESGKKVKKSVSEIIVPDSDDDYEIDKSSKSKIVSKSESTGKISSKSRSLDVRKTDKDVNKSESVEHSSKSRSKSGRVKVDKSVDKEEEDIRRSCVDSEKNELNDNDEELDNVKSNFVTKKRRGKSFRATSEPVDDDHDTNTKSTGTSDVDKLKTPLNKIKQAIEDSDFESPKTKPKSGRKTNKSTKKTTSKRKQQDTEVTETEKTVSDEKLTTLEMIRRRLTMVGSKKNVLEDKTNDESNSRKRSQTDIVPPEQLTDDGSLDCKRSRRQKNPVSYKEKPLGTKLRQGDQFFFSSSKVKAEQARVDLLRKMGTNVPKVSKDDKENVEQQC